MALSLRSVGYNRAYSPLDVDPILINPWSLIGGWGPSPHFTQGHPLINKLGLRNVESTVPDRPFNRDPYIIHLSIAL